MLPSQAVIGLCLSVLQPEFDALRKRDAACVFNRLSGLSQGELERSAGIEPASYGWKPLALPLSYERMIYSSRRSTRLALGRDLSPMLAQSGRLLNLQLPNRRLNQIS
jgi:hypothetical protein